MNTRSLQLLAIILVLASPLIVSAQQSPASASAEILTLDQAISLALHDNRQVKNAQLAVGKAGDAQAAARTLRLPSMHMY